METQECVVPVVHPNGQGEGVNGAALFSHDPEQAFREAERIVSVVAKRCSGPGYLVNIRGKQYPKIEWWTTVSASLGLFPQTVFARRLDRDDEIAYEARVEVRRQGVVIASGEAMCSNKEDRWSKADEYAIKSMAITRASGKAYRIPLSFLAVMAGLEATPAEEMTPDVQHLGKNNGEPATSRQIEAVRALIDNPKVYPDEKRQIHELLEAGLSRRKSKEILDFYYGISVLVDGVWTKTGNGQLDLRS